MKAKKGIVFSILGLFYLILIVIILSLLIWFGFRIADAFSAFFNFLTTWWWAIGLSISALLFRDQIRAIINAILRRFGVKV